MGPPIKPDTIVRHAYGIFSSYDQEQAHTEGEHGTWLAGAKFSEINVLYVPRPAQPA
jgi:hypothetical protein